MSEWVLDASALLALLQQEPGRERVAGLSLGDRACIALGHRSGLPVLTADTAWTALDLGPGVEIAALREPWPLPRP